MRTDRETVLGVVGDRYRPLQNRHHFDWFAPFLDSGEACFETCGSLKDGAIVWVLAKLNRDDAAISADDRIRKYLLLSSAHDGSMATSVGFAPIRVVCWNTLSAALNSDRSTLLKIRHTAGQKDALRAARDVINLADETFEATATQYRRLASCPVDSASIRDYVRKVFDAPEPEKQSTRQRNILSRVAELARWGNGNEGRTAWDAYNGVTHYLTHEYGRSAESRLRAIWHGEARRLNDRALTLAIQLAS